MQARKDLSEAGRCFGAFFRGAAPESTAEQARREVGGEMFAQLALDVRALVEGLSNG
jgi:hypothetical protein